MKYDPLPPQVELKKSSIHGHGNYAAEDIPEGYNLGISHIVDESGNFQNDLIRTPLGGYMNHSETPNCQKRQIGNYYIIETLRRVSYGEELTLNYTLYKCGENSGV